MQGCPLLNNEVKCMCPLGLGHFMVQTLKCVGVFWGFAAYCHFLTDLLFYTFVLSCRYPIFNFSVRPSLWLHLRICLYQSLC